MKVADPLVTTTGERSHSQLGIQACADKNQDDGCQQNDRIIHAEAEGTGASGKHGGTERIDDVGQGIQVRNHLEPRRHNGGGIDCVAGKKTAAS